MAGVELLEELPGGLLRVRVREGDGFLRLDRNQLGVEVRADGRKVYYVDHSSPDSKFWAERIPGPAPAPPEGARAALERLRNLPSLSPADLAGIAPLLALFPPEVYFVRVNEFSVRETRDWLHILLGLGRRLLGEKLRRGAASRFFESTRTPVHSDWILSPYLLPVEDPAAVERGALSEVRKRIEAGDRPCAFGPTVFLPKKALEGLNPMLVVSVVLWGTAVVKAYAALDRPARILSVIRTDWTADYLGEVLRRF